MDYRILETHRIGGREWLTCFLHHSIAEQNDKSAKSAAELTNTEYLGDNKLRQARNNYLLNTLIYLVQCGVVFPFINANIR